MTDTRAAVDAVVARYETLAAADLPQLAALYAADARFKDPFNDVRGRDAIGRVFGHMFATVEAPRFAVHERIVDGRQCFLVWDFTFRRRGAAAAQTIRGGSHLVFDAAGLITLHRDYWDAAEELYATLPLLGPLMRWLQRRLRAG